MFIYQAIPDPDDLLALEPEELAGYLIEHLNSDPYARQRISRPDFSNGPAFENVWGGAKIEDCRRALMEAWMVLEREGLVAPEPGNQSEFFFLTRRGRRLTNRTDYQAFRHARLFPKDSIHPKLSKVYPLFLRGDYETAVFQAFKEIEVTVRNATHTLDPKFYGVDLIRQAFHPRTGPLTDASEKDAEKEALVALFAGAIGRFKNPTAHRHIELTSPEETVEILLFASLLLRVLDDRISKNGNQ